MTRRPSRLLRALILAGLVTMPTRPVLADLWYEHYAAAQEALEEERWSDAIEEINSALEKKGDSGARVRTYGMKFTAYFPYLKLGIAYYNLDQLEAALQAFETEEQLGAIEDSEKSLVELRDYRQATLRRQRERREQETRRIADIVSGGLAEAARFEEGGELDKAIAAVSNALAVSPEHLEAQATLTRLREKLAERQQQEELETRVATLVERGRDLLTRGDLAQGSSVLCQALALADNQEARELLDQAQGRLRAELQAETAERSSAIAGGLSEAASLQQSGRLDAALERLQSVLALDPANRQALALEARLLTARAEEDRAEQDRLRLESIQGFLGAAEAALGAGRYEDALANANRVLALEAGHPTALEQLARAYRAVNVRLLGGAQRQNFPPAIRFDDQRREHEGLLAEFVGDRDFHMSGVVIDDSPVEIVFFDGDTRIEKAHDQTVGDLEIAEFQLAPDQPTGVFTIRSQAVGDLFITEFQLVRELPVGLSTLRLVATDEQELTSRAKSAVVYRRPRGRSPGLLSATAAGLLLIVGLAVGAHARRRRRLRRRRFNPYMAGAPVLDEKLFFGREQLIERILQTLHNNSLLLHGERRIGKTTLQHQLKRRLEALDDPAYQFYPVYIDLQGTPEDRFFATLAEEIFHELAPVLDGLEPQSSPAGDYTYRDLLGDLRAILKTLRDGTSKRVRLALLIDEVDELNSYDPRVNQKLRSLFMKSFAEDLVAVVSGVSIKREWDREGSPWYNFFEEIDVGPLRLDDARELIERPIRGVLRFADGAVERIVELSDYRPYRIQRLCMKLVSRMYELDRRQVEVDDVEAIGDPSSRGAA
ncbi:MAG: AAA family ATPase [Thermoanaerobaculia bacterium]